MFIKVTQVLIILDLLVLLILNYGLKDAESAVKNKLMDLLAELREVEFLTRFAFRMQKVIKKENMALFSRTQKQKQLLIKVILMMYLNQSILQLYQTHKNLLENIWVGLLIQSQIMSNILIFQSWIRNRPSKKTFD